VAPRLWSQRTTVLDQSPHAEAGSLKDVRGAGHQH
jgi:hypothetical protein